MTAKDKAKELVDRFRIGDRNMKSKAKQCALICVSEMQKLVRCISPKEHYVKDYNYLEEVKQELNKL